jgi:integrase
MGRRGKRVRLGVGLWADAGGLSATVRVGSQPQREKRFRRTEDLAADIRKMQRWQLHTRAEMLGDTPTEAQRDSLAAAVPRFLATIVEGTTTRRDFEKFLATWCATPLGAMDRRAIRRSHVLTQLAQWESEGYAAATLNHRLRSLRKLYDVLDAEDETAINPCAKIRKRKEPEPEIRGTTYDIIEAILSLIPDVGYAEKRGAKRPTFNKSKIRLRVMAWTGLPPEQIRKIRPEHIHWTAKELDVMPRSKGKGVKARRLPLLDEAVAALRDFDAADAYGRFSNAAPWNAWQRAKRRYLAQLREAHAPDIDVLEQTIKRLRVYDLRHSFAALVYETTGSRDAIKDLLLHGSLQTSERYLRRGVITATRSALAMVAAARAVPASASQSRPTLADSGRKRAISLVPIHHGKSAKSRKTAKKSGD